MEIYKELFSKINFTNTLNETSEKNNSFMYFFQRKKQNINP